MSKALRFSEDDMVKALPEFAVGDTVRFTAHDDFEILPTGTLGVVRDQEGESGQVFVAFENGDIRWCDRFEITLSSSNSELAPAAVPPPVDAQADDDELTRLRARVAALEAENIDLKHLIAEMKARAWRVSVGISTIEVDLGKLIRELRESQA